MTYQKGDMQQTRWKLAMNRWIENRTLKNANVWDVTILSTQVTDAYKEPQHKRSTVLPNVATAKGNVTDAQKTSDVTDIMSPVTPTRDCAFCGTAFTFVRNHAKYCCETCKTDARLVRKAFRDGTADGYISALLSRNEAQNEA